MLHALPLWYGVLLFSMVCHEAAHAWAARLGGDPTAYLGGQMSLDPLPHIRRERVGMVWAPLLSFFLFGGAWMLGWASAPCDAGWRLRRPRAAALMAAAGPLANLLIAAAALAALKALLGSGWVEWREAGGQRPFLFAGEGLAGPVVAAGLYLALFLNLILAILNLTPLPPFDGLAVASAFFPPAGRVRLARLSGEYGFVGWLVACWLTGRVFGRVWPMVERALA